MALSTNSIAKYFARLRDPRRNHCKRHMLGDIIFIALCAVICGANDWQQVAAFGRCRQVWLKTYLTLANGIPSHDTFERVFDRLDPQAFLGCFQRWVDSLTRTLGLKHVAIDGKTLRHSGNATMPFKPLHLVSAWASEHHLTLGQVAVDDKSNEITAIPELLELLDVRGALVTIDAMGCQKAIAQKIVAVGGDYVLSVKANQANLLTDIQETIVAVLDNGQEGVDFDIYETKDKKHGREETRTYMTLTDLSKIRNRHEWTELNVIGMYTSTRVVKGKPPSQEAHYFIGSRQAGARVYGNAVRQHWSIENKLHWQLDVTFGEDANRVQNRHGAANLGLLRRVALSMLKRHPGKESMACKRLSAALDTAILEEILTPASNLESV
jgi:predicted transposase YbfD/YdcC